MINTSFLGLQDFHQELPSALKNPAWLILLKSGGLSGDEKKFNQRLACF